MFYIISPSCLTHFKFSGVSKLHDPTTNMKLMQIKEKGKLNRIIKKTTHHTCYIIAFIWNPVTFSKFYLWGTSDHNNNCLRWWRIEKKPGRTNLILIRKTKMKPPEASRLFRSYDYRITLLLRQRFLTYIKDWPANIYLYRSLNTCKFLEP